VNRVFVRLVNEPVPTGQRAYSVHILELNLTSYSFPNSKPPNFKFVWYSYDVNEKSIILLAFFMTF
jgi:hypothetical protein